MARRARPTEAEIKRIIRAAQAMGLRVTGIRREGDRTEVMTGVERHGSDPAADYERWKAARNARAS